MFDIQKTDLGWRIISASREQVMQELMYSMFADLIMCIEDSLTWNEVYEIYLDAAETNSSLMLNFKNHSYLAFYCIIHGGVVTGGSICSIILP